MKDREPGLGGRALRVAAVVSLVLSGLSLGACQKSAHDPDATPRPTPTPIPTRPPWPTFPQPTHAEKDPGDWQQSVVVQSGPTI